MNKIMMFETTHHALWAEDIARQKGFAVEVVPAPEGSTAKCGMALEVLAETVDELEAALAQEGIPFTILT
jgi:diphthamide biosynthesis methyltransferase